jgi:hypothetical protein
MHSLLIGGWAEAAGHGGGACEETLQNYYYTHVGPGHCALLAALTFGQKLMIQLTCSDI